MGHDSLAATRRKGSLRERRVTGAPLVFSREGDVV